MGSKVQSVSMHNVRVRNWSVVAMVYPTIIYLCYIHNKEYARKKKQWPTQIMEVCTNYGTEKLSKV